jgi:Phosphotransferase enzyme family.
MRFIGDNYNLVPTGIAEAKRGFYGETWRLVCGGDVYFVKLDYSPKHKAIYADSFNVVRALTDAGVDFIPKVIKTTAGELYSQFNGAVVGVFDWIDGENIQNNITKLAEYERLAEIYRLAPKNLEVSSETFSCSSVSYFHDLKAKIDCGADEASNLIFRMLDNYSDVIAHREERHAFFTKRCRGDLSHFYLTHGDAGGNIIISSGKYYIVDWDLPLLAPPERDAWFCLHWKWACDAFERSLCVNGIDYKLNTDRLAYYCYESFFIYLGEYLDAFLALPESRGNFEKILKGFFNGWIKEELDYADTVQ